MPLSVGDKLGHYQVISLLGQGGMGEVYRARDTKLKRDVAIKVLPEVFARDPERMARFQREAEVLASLNHPNIGQIYGVEDRALVMELVEGESPKGPMPFEETWKICSQIADALEYAHDKGIIHRDLKPANIKITPDGVVKLLDFGLAKAFRAESVAPEDSDNSPTLTLGATQVGVILGTAAYMAPEQAKGKNVDKRADIWAFGVMVYELLTGQRLFNGKDVSDTLAQVLTKMPEFEQVPAKARRLLRSCLEKEPQRRLRDIGDAWRQLEETPTAEPSPVVVHELKSGLWWKIAAGVFAMAGIAAGLVAYRHVREDPQPMMKFTVLAPQNPDISVNYTLHAISPDGRRIAFAARKGGATQLWVRELDSITPTHSREPRVGMAHSGRRIAVTWVSSRTANLRKLT